jgi:hypothetical protein
MHSCKELYAHMYVIAFRLRTGFRSFNAETDFMNCFLCWVSPLQPYVHMYKHMYMFTYMCMYIGMHVCMYVCLGIYIHTYVSTPWFISLVALTCNRIGCESQERFLIRVGIFYSPLSVQTNWIIGMPSWVAHSDRWPHWNKP